MQTQQSTSSKTGGRPGEELYAVAVEIYHQGQLVKAAIKYLHATDEQNARVRFRHAYPNARRYRIVAIARPIGYFVNDKHGEDLSLN